MGCRRNLEDAVGALMKVEPAAFSQCLQSHCQPRFQQWLSNKETKTLGLFLACDLIEHLGEGSCSQWPAFMPAVMESLHDESADVRTPAAFAVSLAAPLQQFSEATAPAYQKLFQLLQRPAPKKKDTTAKVAQDNAVSALVSMCIHKPIPETAEAWKLVLTKLPLREDEDEAKKVHKKIAQAILDQNVAMLGENFANLGKLLSILAEIEKEESLCEKETDEKIHQIFKSLPQQKIVECGGELSEKQQKKIENILR